jgi:vacuolar-type H+-ATPase subunit I/STV1
MTKKKYHRLKPKDWDQIQLLIKGGLSTKQIAEVTDRSHSLIGSARKFKTLDEFRQYEADMKAKSRAKQAIKPEVKVTQMESFLFDDPKAVNPYDKLLEQLINQTAILSSKMSEVAVEMMELAKAQNRHIDVLEHQVEEFMNTTNQRFGFVAARLDKIEANRRQDQPTASEEMPY